VVGRGDRLPRICDRGARPSGRRGPRGALRLPHSGLQTLGL